MNNPTTARYNVIAALDFSPLGERAVEEALLLCEGKAHAQVHVLTVGWGEPGGIRLPGPEGLLLAEPEAQQAVGERVSAIIKRIEQRHPPLTTEKVAIYVAEGERAERICALASNIDADMIVLGTHGRSGLERWVLGSVAEEVVRRATCGVWVLKPRDFLAGEQLPPIEPPLKQGEHALKPFNHRPTYHYVQRADRSAGRIMPLG